MTTVETPDCVFGLTGWENSVWNILTQLLDFDCLNAKLIPEPEHEGGITFKAEDSDDGGDEMRRLHVECEEPAAVPAVLPGWGGGAGSDVQTSDVQPENPPPFGLMNRTPEGFSYGYVT